MAEIQPTRRLILATDFDDTSVEAVEWTVANLLQNGDEVHLVHAVQDDGIIDPDFSDMGVVAVNDAEQQRAIRAAELNAKQWADTLENEILPPKRVKVVPHAFIGAPGPLIVEKAETLDCDFIVVGTHRRGLLSELVLGSVSNYCLTHSKKPVLIVSQHKGQ
ncbi:uncharacterized protein BJ171DRAFT_515579 [Polychytrium aggregatum]|uniref:uncharacterized protein n=1 Tax=Polychytrium aggregatum TaxID=110093 RepID=UPI0022FDFF1C|nr:uncharacterized protein BJ171DRAFT_515579 [Polychytrium aggregatum]KAI9202056.1 hypothetical protein BJ171DRAFT_515579 [Polychytrium aggregatum]